MKNIQERSKGIACNISNLGLVHECLVEKVGRVLLFDLLFLLLVFFLDFTILAVLILGLLLLLHRHTGDVKPHLDQFVWARSGLLATVLRATRLASGTILSIAQSKLHGNFVFSGKVRIRDFGVRQLESWSVLDVKGQLGLGEFRLSPVPSSQSMLARFDIDPVPDFKCLAQPFKILDDHPPKLVRKRPPPGGGNE